MDVSFDMPASPVTGRPGVRVVDSFSTRDIIRLYRQQENVDVAGYFKDEEIYLLECPDSGYRFYYPNSAGGPEFYQALAGENEKRGHDYDREWGEDHAFAYDRIQPGDRVLEIGCSSGKFLKRVTDKTPHVVGLDFDEEAIEKATARGISAVSESIETHAAKHPAEYDVVCALQVLEHLTTLTPVMRAIAELLKPGGRFVLSVPNNEPYVQRFSKYDPLNMPPHHAGLWNLESLRRMAEIFGFEIAEYHHFGTRGILADAYLRAKLLTDVRTLPRRHSSYEKLKMLAAAAITVPLSTFDYAVKGLRNHGNLCVAMRKVDVVSEIAA